MIEAMRMVMVLLGTRKLLLTGMAHCDSMYAIAENQPHAAKTEPMNMDEYVIGIDVGTTGTKSMLFSVSGEIKGHAYMPYPVLTPRPNTCVQRAEDWWTALTTTVHTIVSEAGVGEKVRAISLSLQGGTLAPVDREGKPLIDAIVWSDKRAEAQRDAFSARFGADYMYQKTGWGLGGGLNAMQIAWLRENEPSVFEKTDRFLSVPDYISYRLTGRAAVDISDAGINQLCDIRAGAYDPAILDFCGIDESKLAEIVPSSTPIGPLTSQAKRALGLSGDVLLVSGAHDQYAVALGAGLTRAGDALIGSGTAWVVTALADEPHFETGFCQSVSAVAGKWGSMISLSNGGVCLDWLRANVALSLPNSETLPFGVIDDEAEKRAPGANGLQFFPYFGGAAYPLEQGACKAAFIGLDRSHDRFDMARAVMEGVTMQTAWTLERFRERFGTGALHLAGGAAKSAFWTQLVANVTGEAVRVPKVADLACVGAAIMAGVGAGLYADMDEGCRALTVGERVVEPQRELVKRYREASKLYRKRAAALADMYA